MMFTLRTAILIIGAVCLIIDKRPVIGVLVLVAALL